MSGVRPFLPGPSVAEPRALGTALPRIAMAPVPSPWTPGDASAPAAPVVPAIDVASIESAARERGRLDGLAETEALRARLREAIDALVAVRATELMASADLIAEAASAAVAGWLEGATPAVTFGPLIRGWMARVSGPAVARVAPERVAELREVIGDAPIAVEPDASLRGHDLKISAPGHELAHAWDERFAELRSTIAAAVEEARR